MEFSQQLKYFLILIALITQSCISEPQTLENGYTLPEATRENVRKVIQKAKNDQVFVKGGSFVMGDSGYLYKGERVYWSFWLDNFPAHKVTLDSFSISKYEVTFWEYDVYTNSLKKEPISMRSQHLPRRRDNYPVGDTTWRKANDYCQWLAKETGLPFALPTEAQWGYAARSRGQNVGYATDNGKMEPGINYRNFGQKIYPVGSFPANPLGLYDMAGNHSEWVWDWYDKKYYGKSPELNPKGPITGTEKVLRSVDPLSTPSTVTVYTRTKHKTVFEKNDTESLRFLYYYGFRCVVNSPKPIKH